MRLMKYLFALAGLIMFCGADQHWAFAMLGCACLAGIILIQQLEYEEYKDILLDNDLYERMY